MKKKGPILGIIIISIIAEILYLFQGQQIQSFVMAIVVIGYLYSRQILVPKLNANRDLANEGDEKSKKIFSSLHLQSVSINIIQMLFLALILFL